MKTIAKKGLGLFPLILLISGPIDSIRNLPSAALFGSSLIFFFILAAIVFLIPTALVAAELSVTCKEHGGIYQWVKLALGEKMGFLAVWLQWINTMVWFPTILSFIAGTLSYLIDPTLAQHKGYLLTVILSVFWVLTLFNLKGIQVSVKFIKISSILGLILPMLIIIGLAAHWLLTGKVSYVNFTSQQMLPSLHHMDNWISLTAIVAGFLGMELACVHIKEVHQPQKNFPKALSISVLLILVTMIAGSLAIAIVLPSDKIQLVNGVVQAFSEFFGAYHLYWMVPIITVMILLGSVGGMMSWIISPAKGLLEAAESNYLPALFKKKNAHGVAAPLLITQAVLVSVICLSFLFLSSVNSFYWLLTALSTQLYMLMYVLMFIASIKIKHQQPNQENSVIPGGKFGIWFVSLLGITGCLITLVVGFIPPKDIFNGTLTQYILITLIGMILMILPGIKVTLPAIKQVFQRKISALELG